MRASVPCLLLLALVPLSAAAQDARLAGRFNPTRAPEADTRPPVGEARLLVEDDGDLRVDLVVSGLTERATSATLHIGDGGNSTQQVARLDVSFDGGVARVIGGRATLSPLVAQQVRKGDAYLVLRTNEHPEGVMRAELAPEARSLGSIEPPR